MKRQDLNKRKQHIELEREKARLYYRSRYGILSLIHPLQHRQEGLPGKGKDVLFDDLNPQERSDFTEIYGAFDYAYPLDHNVEMSGQDRDKERILIDSLNREEDPSAYLNGLLGRIMELQNGLVSGDFEILRGRPRRRPELLPAPRKFYLFRRFYRRSRDGDRELIFRRLHW